MVCGFVDLFNNLKSAANTDGEVPGLFDICKVLSFLDCTVDSLLCCSILILFVEIWVHHCQDSHLAETKMVAST
jgi:hypothetical protein